MTLLYLLLFIKDGEKINQVGVTIKTLLNKGFSQIWIANKLKISKQKVNYWANHQIKFIIKRRRKLVEKIYQKNNIFCRG